MRVECWKFVSSCCTDEWPEQEVFPTTSWNYGLIIDRDNLADSLQVIETGKISDQPWTAESAPVEIKAKGKKIFKWKLKNETVAVGMLVWIWKDL